MLLAEARLCGSLCCEGREINNPLGGLFNAIDTLKRHGGDRNTRNVSLDLVERGLNVHRTRPISRSRP